MSSSPFVIQSFQLERSNLPGYRPESLLPGQEFVNEADLVRCIGLENGSMFCRTIDVSREGLLLAAVDNTRDLDKPLSTAAVEALASKVAKSLLGVPGGVATLGIDGKVSPSQATLSEVYAGTWNASSNTPLLQDGVVPGAGVYYTVQTAGTTALGGISAWTVGDRIQSNGTVWTRIPGVSITAASVPVSPPPGRPYTNLQAATQDLQGQVDTKLPLAGGTVTGNLSVTGTASFGGYVTFQASIEVKGVALVDAALFKRHATSTGITGNVQSDVYANSLRWYENGGSLRGASLDLTACASGAGSYLWHSGNFNPATKATLGTDVSFTRVSLTALGTADNIRVGNDATIGDVDVANTVGIRGLSNANVAQLQMGATGALFIYDSANWIVRGGGNLYVQPTGGGSFPVWHSGNYNPANYAALYAVASFAGIQLNNGQGGNTYLYRDAGQENFVVRTGNGSVTWPFRYTSISSDGYFTTPIGARVSGALNVGDAVVVGEGKTSSSIQMCDSDQGHRFVHNNSGTIGFLGADGAWKFRVQDDGNWWSSYGGYLSDILASINGKQAALGFTPVRQGGGAGQANNVVYIGWDGTDRLKAQIDNVDIGVIHTDSWLNPLIDMRWVHAGDLNNDWNLGNLDFLEPYNGAAITTRITQYLGGNYVASGFRWRYLQKRDRYGNWYTVGYA